MELKVNENGAVEFIFLTNGTRVKNQMTEREAKELITSGKIKKKGNQIIVDDKFIFEIEGDTEEVIEEVVEVVEEVVKPASDVEEVKEAKIKKKKDVPLKEAKEGKPLTKKPRKKNKK